MNINKKLREIVNQRLSLEELEKSQTRCGCEFQIKTMFFDDLKPHYPTLVLGIINTQKGKKVLAKWNQYGQCWISNTRIKSYDLLTPSQKVIEEAKQALNV